MTTTDLSPATITRLARLAIDLSGDSADPRSIAALVAAETSALPPGAEELAVAAAAAVEDAPRRALADAARACERALTARLRPEDATAYVRGAVEDVLDCARHAYLSRERRAGRDETADGLAAAERDALDAVRAIYEADLTRP